MLILITWASITLAGPSGARSTPTVCDMIRSHAQDTVKGRDSELIRDNSIVQERPSFRTRSPLNNIFDPQFNQQQFTRAVDSLLRTHPELKGPFLRELFISSGSLAEYAARSPLESFNQQLLRDSRFTPFERMSLIAKRYAIYNSSDRSLKSYQLDIRRTIQWWLEEVFK